MNNKTKNLLLAYFLIQSIQGIASAEINPVGGTYDARVRTIAYNPKQVFQITTFFGISTHIEFAKDEIIMVTALGDSDAWQVMPSENHLFIKPIADKANTNLTVTTNKRAYQFALATNKKEIDDPSAWNSSDLIYSLQFTYPEEEAEQARLKNEAKREKSRQRYEINKEKKLNSELKNIIKNKNTNYWKAGDTEISPTSIYDDARFTYLTFENNTDIPAIYSVDAKGVEAIVNFSVDKNQIVIHRTYKMLRLRRGKLVICLDNRGFSSGIDNITGTSSDNIERVIKPIQKEAK